MKATFIRHCKCLKTPYDNWRNLSLNQYTLLSKGEIDPGINLNKCKKCTDSIFPDVELIITSIHLRAVQTGQLIKRLNNLDVDLKEDPCLNETYWNPREFISPKEWRVACKTGKLSLFDYRLNAFLNDNAPKSAREIFIQLSNLDKTLKNLRHKNVLCVTHSFLLRMIDIYFLRGISDYNILNKDLIKDTRSRRLIIEI